MTVTLRCLIGLLSALAFGLPDASLAADNQFPFESELLLDAKPPKGADRPGGLGDTFDWALLKALDPSLGFMSPQMSLSMVDLPQPEGPSTETNSPGRTLQLTSCNAVSGPRVVRYVRPTCSSAM